MIFAFDLVGWGTLALAAATTVMAAVTWSVSRQTARAATAAEKELEESHLLLRASQDQVTASQAQAQAANEALAASVRPLLVPATGLEDFDHGAIRYYEANGFESGRTDAPPVATWFRGAHPSGVEVQWVIVKVRNIGAGAAVVDQRPDGLFLRTMMGRDVPGTATSLILAPGDFAYLAFADTTTLDDPNSLASMLSLAEHSPSYPQKLTVVVRYADVGHKQSRVSHMRFHPRDQSRLDFVDVDIDPAPRT